MRVFLASTYVDLAEYRRRTAEAIERLDQQTERMEAFGARPEEPREACLREVDRCDLFVGIYAHRYGYVPEGSDTSITESEFAYAKERGKPIFCFLVDEDTPWPPRMIEPEPGRTRLTRFKDVIRTRHVMDTFTTPEDLATKVGTSLGRYLLALTHIPMVAEPRNAVNGSPDHQRADREATLNALSATERIADRTHQYLVQRRIGGTRDRSKEEALADEWRKAGVMLAGLDAPFGLIEACFYKSMYWILPEGWQENPTLESQIKLEVVRAKSRSWLLARLGY